MAKLASDQKWWALEKRITMKTIDREQERLVTFNGKNAIEWANHHGNLCMGRKLRQVFHP
jgi:hypothetical protein